MDDRHVGALDGDPRSPSFLGRPGCVGHGENEHTGGQRQGGQYQPSLGVLTTEV